MRHTLSSSLFVALITLITLTGCIPETYTFEISNALKSLNLIELNTKHMDISNSLSTLRENNLEHITSIQDYLMNFAEIKIGKADTCKIKAQLKDYLKTIQRNIDSVNKRYSFLLFFQLQFELHLLQK